MLANNKYIINTLWIFLEKVIRMLCGFGISVLLANYLGASNFGILAYALSLIAIFSSIGQLGIAGIVVRELVAKKFPSAEILATTFTLKTLGCLIGTILLLIYIFFIDNGEQYENNIILILMISIIFLPFNVIDFWFQSLVKSKYTSISHMASLLIGALIKLVFIAYGFSLVFFAFANVFQALLLAIFLIIFFFKKSEIKLKQLTFSSNAAKAMLSDSMLAFLGSLFAVMYLKIDQVMLKSIIGTEEVGVYALAASFSEVWYFIPTAICASIFPRMIELRDLDKKTYKKYLQYLFDFLFLLGFLTAILISIVSDYFFYNFMNESFNRSSDILKIHVWAGVFIFMRAAFSRWIIAEGILIFSLLSNVLGFVINVLMNYWLIDIYGGRGAAFATLFSYAVASYFSLIFFSKTRPVFFLMTNSLFFFWRLHSIINFLSNLRSKNAKQ